MERNERLKCYQEILARSSSKTLSLSDLIWEVRTVSRSQLEKDLQVMGIEPSPALAVQGLLKAVEQALGGTHGRVPRFSRFEYASPFGHGRVESQPITAATLKELHSGLCSPVAEWAATDLAARLDLVDSPNRLLCLSALKEGRHANPHQIRTVRRFLNHLGGSGIVADEVGLGKTLEGGMIIQEYLLRGLVKSWLLLVPASLVKTWEDELHDFLPLQFKEPKSRVEASAEPGVLLSIDRAKGKMREVLRDRKWDLVVVDECHILKNAATQNYKFVYSLSKKYCLLISATPIQNEVRDLYNLVNLCKPGLLKSWNDFKRNYLSDRRRPTETKRLRELLSSTITRTRRQETGLSTWKKRTVVPVAIELTPEEDAYHKEVVEYVRFLYEKHARGSVMLGREPEQGVPELELLLILILKELASSQEAVRKTLAGSLRKRVEESCKQRGDDRDLQRLDGVVAAVRACKVQSKLGAFLDRLEELKEHGKVIVFTEFRGTQDLLVHALRARGEQPVIFNGDLRRTEKTRAQEAFMEPDRRFMVSTETGGQGLNLQFANVVVNYDFPWNPMRLEQRIGRVDRFKQERSIWVYNLFARGTIEAYIMTVLLEKLVMTRKIVGEIADILSFVSEDFDVEASINKIVLESKNFEEMKERFAKLEEILAKGAEEYDISRRKTDQALLHLPRVADPPGAADPAVVASFLQAFAVARKGSATVQGSAVELQLDAAAAGNLGCEPSQTIRLEAANDLQEWRDYPLIHSFMEQQLRRLPGCFRATYRKRERTETARDFFTRAIQGFAGAKPKLLSVDAEVLRWTIKAAFRGEGMRERLQVGLAVPSLRLARLEDAAEMLLADYLAPAGASELGPRDIDWALRTILSQLEEALEGDLKAHWVVLEGERAKAQLRAESYYDALVRVDAETQGLADGDGTSRQQLEAERDTILADLEKRYDIRLAFTPIALGLLRATVNIAQTSAWTVAKLAFSQRLFSSGCSLCGRLLDTFFVEDGELVCKSCRQAQDQGAAFLA